MVPEARGAGPLVIGVGNPLRGDDGVGPWIARALAARGHRALVHGGDGTGLIDLFEAASHVILVDAARSGAVAGTLHVFDAREASLPAHFFHYSTHLFGLAEAVETARALGALPPILWVYGIEGACFDVGEALSAPVRAGAAALVARLLAHDFTDAQRIA